VVVGLLMGCSFMGLLSEATYVLSSIQEYPNKQGFEAELELIQHTTNLTLGPDITPLHFIVRLEEGSRVHIYISDYSNSRWEVPYSLIPRPKVYAESTTTTTKDNGPNLLAITYTKKPFGFAITRISNGEVLFNSTPIAAESSSSSSSIFNAMVFKDQYLEISTQLPNTASLFGLGESTRPDGLKLPHNQTSTLFATDTGAVNVNVDLYGSYPYYIDVREKGVAHGVLLLNSNGMDVTYGLDGTSLTFRVVGGIFDFYFFPGPSAKAVVAQYTQLVGRPAPMPYWSFGFHQCRWGYRNVSMDRYVVEHFKEANIPLDTMWNDIDYMDEYKDFTTDPIQFPIPELRAFVDELHENGQHYVMIIDPGISIAYSDYGTLNRGLKDDIFLKNQNGEDYIGQVWPGPVYFPDFLNPKTTQWWTNEVAIFHNQIPFDGLWIDMNEISNFCTGTFCSWNGTIFGGDTTCYLDCTLTHTKFDDPPYRINHYGDYADIGYKTIAMTVQHYNGALEYNTHNLYGFTESIATNTAITKVRNKRAFVLARSTFLGSGAHTAHWTGDNGATFDDLAYSITTILTSGLEGVPMVGADICGFAGNGTEELCNRWIQTGAFYPFSRAHSNIENVPKELYIWKSVTLSAQRALGLRYRLLPYFYTLNYEAHISGYPIARALFFVFPDDPVTLDVNYQFLIGDSILVSPVVTSNVTSVTAYFPKGSWYNLFDLSRIDSHGSWFKLAAPLEVVNVHVYEGSIVPMQESALTSTLVRKSPFTLLVVFSTDESKLTATGELFLDSGDDIVIGIEQGKSSFITFIAKVEGGCGILKSQVVEGDYAKEQGWIIETVTILGLDKLPNSVSINSVSVTSSIHITLTKDIPSLELSGLKLYVGESFELEWK
jgi:alpha-D-xyloside xylohydrolase